MSGSNHHDSDIMVTPGRPCAWCARNDDDGSPLTAAERAAMQERHCYRCDLHVPEDVGEIAGERLFCSYDCIRSFYDD